MFQSGTVKTILRGATGAAKPLSVKYTYGVCSEAIESYCNIIVV